MSACCCLGNAKNVPVLSMSGREKVKQKNDSQISGNMGINAKDITSNENNANEKEHHLEWNMLSLEQLNSLLTLTVEEVQLQLEEVLSFKNHKTCLKEAALLEYFVSGFWWAKEMNFARQQMSCFMALLQMLLDNIREKNMPFADNYKEFAKAVAGTRKSLAPEDDCGHLFDVDQAIAITDYFKFSLFQHYKLYEFLFAEPREERQFKMKESIEVVSPADFAAPLEEGMPVDVFFRYVAPVPAAQPEEVDTSVKLGVQEEAPPVEQADLTNT